MFMVTRSGCPQPLSAFFRSLLALSLLAVLSGCANTTTTSVGVTTNQAPKFQELGR
jgi:hypothetical protein